MPGKITTLKLVDDTDVFPNTKDENIPNTIMRVTDLSKYLNQLKSINITGDIDSTTITSDIATFTTANISTLNVSGVSQFEGEATFGHNIHVDGNVIVNGIDNIVDKDGNKIVKNETLDKFTKQFYDNCDVGLYMNRRIHSYTFLCNGEGKIRIPYSDKVTNLCSLCENFELRGQKAEEIIDLKLPDIPNQVQASEMFSYASCGDIYLGDITLYYPYGTFLKLKNTKHIYVSKGKTAKVIGILGGTFAYADSLVEIGPIDLSEAIKISGAFNESHSLKSIHCTHFRVSFDISSSTAFEQSDLVEIISNLDPVSTAQTLTMGSTNLAKLTQEQILVATGKGWTLA